MITQRFLGLRPIAYGSFGGRLTVGTGRYLSPRRSEAAHSLAKKVCLPRVEDATSGWRQKARVLAFLLVITSMIWILAQGASAFFQAFNRPLSRGSEWEALASRNVPIPALLLDWQFP